MNTVSSININFVCLGNICRSPLAHTVMEGLLTKKGLANQILVDSSGIGSWHVGNSSDSRMRETANSHGYTITHKAQQFHYQDGESFDYIYAMDQSIYESILTILPEHFYNKVLHFRHLDPHAPSTDVPDPYYGGSDGFEQVFQIVNKNCQLILKNLIDRHGFIEIKN